MIVGFRLERTDEVCPSPKTLILIKNPSGRTIQFNQDLLQHQICDFNKEMLLSGGDSEGNLICKIGFHDLFDPGQGPFESFHAFRVKLRTRPINNMRHCFFK